MDRHGRWTRAVIEPPPGMRHGPGYGMVRNMYASHEAARRTLSTQILSTLAKTCEHTGLRQGPATDALVDQLLVEITSPSVRWALALLGDAPWIRVAEHLPDPGVEVLAWDGRLVWLASIVDGDNEESVLRQVEGRGGDLTHWMPLPEPPKE